MDRLLEIKIILNTLCRQYMGSEDINVGIRTPQERLDFQKSLEGISSDEIRRRFELFDSYKKELENIQGQDINDLHDKAINAAIYFSDEIRRRDDRVKEIENVISNQRLRTLVKLSKIKMEKAQARIDILTNNLEKASDLEKPTIEAELEYRKNEFNNSKNLYDKSSSELDRLSKMVESINLTGKEIGTDNFENNEEEEQDYDAKLSLEQKVSEINPVGEISSDNANNITNDEFDQSNIVDEISSNNNVNNEDNIDNDVFNQSNVIEYKNGMTFGELISAIIMATNIESIILQNNLKEIYPNATLDSLISFEEASNFAKQYHLIVKNNNVKNTNESGNLDPILPVPGVANEPNNSEEPENLIPIIPVFNNDNELDTSEEQKSNKEPGNLIPILPATGTGDEPETPVVQSDDEKDDKDDKDEVIAVANPSKNLWLKITGIVALIGTAIGALLSGAKLSEIADYLKDGISQTQESITNNYYINNITGGGNDDQDENQEVEPENIPSNNTGESTNNNTPSNDTSSETAEDSTFDNTDDNGGNDDSGDDDSGDDDEEEKDEVGYHLDTENSTPSVTMPESIVFGSDLSNPNAETTEITASGDVFNSELGNVGNINLGESTTGDALVTDESIEKAQELVDNLNPTENKPDESIPVGTEGLSDKEADAFYDGLEDYANSLANGFEESFEAQESSAQTLSLK